MKRILIISSILLICFNVFAQKKSLTDTSYKEWTHTEQGIISNDGKYASYIIRNKPYKSFTRVIVSTDQRWKKELPAQSTIKFTDDSKYAFYLKKDTLYQLQAGSEVVLTTPQCRNYQLLHHGNKEWLIYQNTDTIKQVVVKQLGGEKKIVYSGIEEIYANTANGTLVLRSAAYGKHQLKWLDLKTGVMQNIYSGNIPEDIIFDKMGQQMAFRAVDDGINAFWYYQQNYTDCKKIIADHGPGLLGNHTLATNATWAFSSNGRGLYFTQDSIVPNSPKPVADPIISDYRDAYLTRVYNSARRGLLSGRNLSILNLTTTKVKRLLQGAEKPETQPQLTNDVFIFSRRVPPGTTRRLESELRTNFYICVASTGEVFPLKLFADFEFIYSISPEGNCVFKSQVDSPVCAFSISTKKMHTLTGTKHFGEVRFSSTSIKNLTRFLGWDMSGRYILIQDRFDIWLIDSKNENHPKNLTKDIGNKTSTIFYPINHDNGIQYRKDQLIYLAGFNIDSKQASIHTLQIEKKDFKQLIKLNTNLSMPYYDVSGSTFCKARDANSYLIQIEDVTHSPNYFHTKDFKELTALSNEYSEQNYNWLTAELMSYKDSSGQKYQAILYKPQNFDASKKYPVIFEYYGHVSNDLFKYVSPKPVSSDVNIPLMVNAGYLIVRPDIMRIDGKTAAMSALISINAVADHMVKMSFTDSSRLGLAGHSFGGYETNYIITHSNRFSAALSGAGISNVIQYVNDVNNETGGDNENYVKYVFGYSQSMDSLALPYINDSPVLFAKNINTPLLLVHNDEDGTVDVSQTVQFFNQIRALRKPVWWLNYSGEHHTIQKIQYQMDYQQKVKQFFDYFLLQKPVPDWMNKPNTY